MEKRFSVFCIFAAFLFCCCFYACLQDEGFDRHKKEVRFFDASAADECLCSIVAQLKQKNDSADFVTDFVDKYGYPLWRNAYRFPEKENLVFAVPVKSTVSGAEINAIWFFSVASERTEYRIYSREMVDCFLSEVGGDGIEETWMFDYFTRKVLHKEPKSNLMFKEDSVATSTRSMIIVETEHCVHAYAGYEGAEGYLGMHCWTTTTALFLSDSRFMINGGGDGGYGFMDTGYGAGGGGGSGNGNGDSSPRPNTDTQTDPTSPCGKAQTLSSNAALKSKVNELFNSVQNYRAGDKENGWIKTAAGQYILPSERTAGRVKYSASSLAGQKIMEQYHSHPAGGCIPSFPDLRALATRYKNGQIDVANFSYGVVSSMGCLTMVITSEEAFKVFAEKVLNDMRLKRAYDEMLRIKNTNGVNTAIAKFIDYLKESVSGLDVLFSQASYDNNNSVSLTDWKAKDSNGNASISDYKCN